MHQLSINHFGTAEMAYTGPVPWHGLGQQVSPDATVDEWKRAAGLDWSVLREPVLYPGKAEQGADQNLLQYPTYHVLHRSDNMKPLSVVNERYKIVQPTEVLNFFKDLVKTAGFRIETAGALKEGRRIWVLANTGLAREIVPGDLVKGYILLATSYDGQMATTGMYTSTRVVCNNTLQMALSKDAQLGLKIRHSRVFNPELVKEQLGIAAHQVWETYLDRMQSLASVQLTQASASTVLERILSTRLPSASQVDVTETRGFKKIIELFRGAGRGSTIPGVENTAWGLLNAVTQFVDFERRSHTNGSRLDSAWFGEGARMKDDAVSQLLTLV